MKQTVCIGDSNTFGFDPQSLWGGRYAKEIRWTGRLSAAGFSVQNLGVNGLSVSQETVHSVLTEEVLSAQPCGLVTVMLGSNDLLMGLSAEETARSMKKLLSLLLEKKAAEQVLLIAPVPMQRGAWVQDAAVVDESRALAETYRLLVEELGIGFADAGEWGIPLSYDGVHFTAEGHRLFAEKLLEELRSLPEALRQTP